MTPTGVLIVYFTLYVLVLTHGVLLRGDGAAVHHGVLVGVVWRSRVPAEALTVHTGLHRVLLLRVVKHGAGRLDGAHHAVSPPLILLREKKEHQ